MHKLRRMHIANAGYKDAFFDGETWEFYNRETGEPVDTVLFANNGAGKTISLSLLYSVIDTPTNRFMRHLKQQHCRFEDYFNDEPALIAIEWDRGLDARGRKLAPLVTAQIVVTKREGGEKKLERIFICFRGDRQFGFDSLPFAGLDKTTRETRLKTRDEVHRWVSECMRRHGESHSIRRADRQVDWRNILEENSIDVMLISKQVDLNKREANTEEFLEFPNERAFLDKFLSLTLNEEKTRLARENLLEGVLKLGNYDVYMERLKAMRGLEQCHSTFRYTAARYLEKRQDLVDAQAEAAGLRAALNDRKQALASQASSLEEEKGATADRISWAEGALKELKADLAACDLESKRRAAEKTAKELFDLEHARDEAKKRLSHLDAALDWKPIEKLASEIHELRDVLALEEKSLEEPKRLVEAAGSELVAALEWHIGQMQRQLLEQEEQCKALKGKERECQQLIEATDNELNSEKEKQGGLNHWFISFDNEKQKQVNREDMQKEESSATAIKRCESESKGAEEERGSVTARIDAIAAQVQDLESVINGLTAQEAAKQEGRHNLLLRVDEGRSKKKSLMENSCLVRVCKSDSVDPESSTVEVLLQEFRNEASQRMIKIERLIDIKESDVESINKFGLAAIDENVHLVAEHLRNAKVRGVMPYATWLAGLKWEPSFLLDFVRSDPARFCGVAVQGTDAFEQTRVLDLSGLDLSRPVVVSLATQELGQVSPISFVIPVGRDEAYDMKAAEILAKNIAQQILDLDEKRLQANLDHDAARDVLGDLAHYLKNWGQGQLAEMESRCSALKSEIEQIRADLVENRRVVAEIQKEKQERKARLTELDKRLWGLGQRHERLRDFLDGWEKHYEAKTEDRDRVLRSIGRLEARRSLLKSDSQKIGSEMERTRDEVGATARKVTELKDDRDGVQMRGPTIPTPLNPEMLDAFRARYEQREENFRNLVGGRFSNIQASLDEKVKVRKGIIEQFGNKHKHCEREEMYRLAGLANLESLRERAETEHSGFVERAADKKSEKKNFDKELQTARNSAAPGIRELAETLLQIASEALAEREGKNRTAQRKLEMDIPDLHQQLRGLENDLKAVRNKETACESFLRGFPVVQSQRKAPVSLEFDPKALGQQVEAIRDRLEKARGAANAAHGEAIGAYDPVRNFVTREEFKRLEPRISGDLNQNNPEGAMTQANDHASLIFDMIRTLEHDLNEKESESQLLRDSLYSLLNESLSMLRQACEGGKIPAGIPRFGGEPVLKMGRHIGTAGKDLKEQMIKGYLAKMVRTKEIPETGNKLAGELIDHLRAMMNLESLDIRILKPTDMGNLSYERIHRAVASGGEGLTAAILLYLVLSRLRANSIVQSSNTLGGFLIADNPFGAVTHKLFLRTQRELARAMNIQLIFTSHVKDYDALAEFPHIINYSKRQQRQDHILIRLAHENIGEPQ